MAGPDVVISVRDLVKSFPDSEGEPLRVLDGVTFDVHRGETLVIMGGSGCGKSTLLNCLIGEYETDGGQILYQTRDMPAPVEISRLTEAKACTMEISMPARIAAHSPSQGLPVCWVTMKAVTAPTAMTPSTPRLRIPERSQMISPMVPRSRGVPATSVRWATDMITSSMDQAFSFAMKRTLFLVKKSPMIRKISKVPLKMSTVAAGNPKEIWMASPPTRMPAKKIAENIT